jgi:hypothetical protein
VSGGTLTPYAAVLLYSSSSPSADYQPLYEETVTIVLATSVAHALERAREVASSRETEFHNQYGETIRWSLERIVDVREITDRIGHGTEVYTRHFSDHEAYRALY